MDATAKLFDGYATITVDRYCELTDMERRFKDYLMDAYKDKQRAADTFDVAWTMPEVSD